MIQKKTDDEAYRQVLLLISDVSSRIQQFVVNCNMLNDNDPTVTRRQGQACAVRVRTTFLAS